MKTFVLILSLGFAATVFADNYRLFDIPRCVVDFDNSTNVVDVSKCPLFHDQHFGDLSFAAGIVCHDTKSLGDEPNLFIYPSSLSDDSSENYVEISERTHYSFMASAVYKMAAREPVFFSMEQFNQWLASGRIDNCQVRLDTPKKITKLSK